MPPYELSHYNSGMPKAFVVGHDSELGNIANEHLRNRGWHVVGTTRRRTHSTTEGLFYCDLSNRETVASACNEVLADRVGIDLVILSVGQLSPIGSFPHIDFETWVSSVEINFLNQVFLIQELLKNLINLEYFGTKFLTFAGSGTNSAPINFSAYTLSKVALIKATELLAAEYVNYYFLSLGTGWMKSAIHDQTIAAGPRAGVAYFETIRRLKEGDFGNPELFREFLDWYISASDIRVSGRNLALQGDNWKDADFLSKLTTSPSAFKLRRVTE